MQGSILDKIVALKRLELAESKLKCPLAEMVARAGEADAPRGFRRALRGSTVSVIAEVKRASPAAGIIRPDCSPAEIGVSYANGGAAAVSVLTDRSYFQGSLQDMQEVRSAITLPVLRKDFVIDAYQLYEARAASADAILLIVSILDYSSLAMLYELAVKLGMDALVEVHTVEEMEQAIRLGAELIGINNRDLKTFLTSLDTTARLAPMAGGDVVLAGLSGISTHDDVRFMAAAGVDAVLVGESLMRSEDVTEACRALTGVPSQPHRRPISRQAATV